MPSEASNSEQLRLQQTRFKGISYVCSKCGTLLYTVLASSVNGDECSPPLKPYQVTERIGRDVVTNSALNLT